MNGNVGLALLLPTLAGLCTLVGGLLIIFVRQPGPRFMALILGFSAGVMILTSFAELLQEAVEQVGFASAYGAFFAGMIGMFLVDVLVPHDFMSEEHHASGDRQKGRMVRTALFLALGIGIHNFPEGIASFTATLHDPTLGLAIAVAIALHNIPEGLAVACPIVAATGKPGKALWWTFLSGMAEPVGALLAAAFLLPLLSAPLLGMTLATVGGVMVFIALDELIPVACSYGQDHLSILGVVSGMVVAALGLWLVHAQ